MQKRRFVLCGLLAMLLSAAAGPKVRAGDLTADLVALEAMRKGLQTPADEVEKRGAELLKEYPADEDRGKIYYHLAFILSQSGMMRRERIQEYSQKALKLPLAPNQRLTLYVCLGDSYRHGAPAIEYPGIRRQAVVPYLEGLNQAAKYNLPDKAPDLSVPGFEGVEVGIKDQAAFFAARQEAERQRELCQLRDALTNQIVTTYNKRPFATEELEELAKAHLEDAASRERLLSEVKDAVANVGPPKTDADRVLAGLPLKPPVQPDFNWVRMVLTLGSLAALLLGFGVFFVLRLRRRRKSGAK